MMEKRYTWWQRVLLPLLLGVVLTVSSLTSLALAQQDEPEMAMNESPVTEPTEPQPFSIIDVITNPVFPQIINPLTYVRIISDQNLQTYKAITSNPTFTLTPNRRLKPGFLYSSITNPNPVEYEGNLWYEINPNEYISSEFVQPVTPTQFRGVSFSRTPETAFGWVVRTTPVVPAPGMQADETTVYKHRYDLVTIYETRYFDEWGWHRIGPDQWIALYDVGAIRPRTTRPSHIPAGERWIEVDLFDQTFAAYDEYDNLIYGTMVSSGLPAPGWETPTGTFRIKKKVKQAKMSGGGRADWYFLEDVTASMYFTGAVAFHAAYWHDDFGRFKSHGCVNMAPTDAHWLYGWSTPVIAPNEPIIKATTENLGTWVWVHEGYVINRGEN